MGMLYEYTGVVEKVRELQTFQSGFSKRTVVLTDDVGTVVNFPNHLAFTFKKERVSKLDNVNPGMRVKIVFAIDGREFEGRDYTDLTGIKLDVLAGGQSAAPAKPIGQIETPPPSAEEVADDTPF